MLQKVFLMVLGIAIYNSGKSLYNHYTELYNNSGGRYTLIDDGITYTCTNDQYGRICYDKDGIILGDHEFWERKKRINKRG